ncbi:MAG: dihydropteroate synthase [Coprococcus sp.]
MIIGNRDFDIEKHTAIMAILNVTPDSFSDGGSYKDMDAVRRRVSQMMAEGADIIDIGGESTRPGHVPVSDEEEIERVIPVVECLKSEFDIPLSVDTYKSAVAIEALKAGCDMINDIWGLQADSAMGTVIAKAGAACCLMHNRNSRDYGEFIPECLKDMKKILETAEQAGIPKEKIILDPGVGFGKNYEHNLMVMKHLKDFKQLGSPLLLGTSRKSMIGLALDLPVTERVEGTLVTTVMAVMAQYAFVRVHDVEANRRAIRMAEAIRDIQL